MNKITIFCIVISQCFFVRNANTVKYSGDRIYVVTPSPKPLQIDEGRSAPFYYHNWMRRADVAMNITTTIPSTTQRTKTPDLIFAEFESDSMRNIRKLLERERADMKTTTTSTTTTRKPISVPNEEETVKYEVPIPYKPQEEKKDMTDYFALYNNLYSNPGNLRGPIYMPSTLPPTQKTPSTTTTTTTTTTESPLHSVHDVWHIIDSQKHDQWIDILPERDQSKNSDEVTPENEDSEEIKVDENFAWPGFGINPSNGGENESRAIRTEHNLGFPYIKLKPFKMKNMKQPQLNSFADNKKGNNMLSMDNFYDIKNPVRGESQDVAPMLTQTIDRYNPAQPYLFYGDSSNSKQSSASSKPMKAVASLVPPPPPPPPKITDDDFPAPIIYDSFPPYAPSDSDSEPPTPLPPAPQAPVSNTINTIYSSPDSDSSNFNFNSGPPMDVGYRYKPPPPVQPLQPTLPPLQKPSGGYSYDKPSITYNTPPMMEGKPKSNGYHYDKPMPANSDLGGYHYNKPMSANSDSVGYNYDKPSKPFENPHEDNSYGHHKPPSYGHDDDEIVYEKPHRYGGQGSKDSDDDMGMAPPDPDAKHSHDPPVDDSGFPHDFPGDLHHFHDDDDDEHAVYHFHHPEPTTTTTTTTEMPRVNRYSYYYLGKKLYYLPLYFSVYFIVYVGALIIKAVLRHKIVYPNSWRPNDQTATFFTKRSVDSWDFSKENLHEITGRVTHYIAKAAEKYLARRKD